MKIEVGSSLNVLPPLLLVVFDSTKFIHVADNLRRFEEHPEARHNASTSGQHLDLAAVRLSQTCSKDCDRPSEPPLSTLI